MKIPFLAICLAGLVTSCATPEKSDIQERFVAAQQQYSYLTTQADSLQKFPRTTDSLGALIGTSEWDWTGGFFPGSLWFIYNQTADTQTKEAAIRWTEKLEAAKNLDQHHDIGFVMYCSYGNAIKYLNDPKKVEAYKAIVIHSANTALKRYDAKVGLIKSWNQKESWDGKTLWKYPVIIDNMMNLEMLCYVSDITGDSKYREVAISHANKTMENHFREDYSTYHVVDYDSLGNAIHQQTNQGYSDNSTWARGQAWAIYGFTMMYRETKDPNYLETAKRAAKFYMEQANLPDDKVPYWDFNAEQPGFNSDVDFSARKLTATPRDASAAAITASALVELSGFTSNEESKSFLDFAKATVKSLSGPEYTAGLKENGGFILKHSTGSLPHNSEVDVPLTYADYYYLEALTRLQMLN